PAITPSLLFKCCSPPPYLHSFPTRRSSDLRPPGVDVVAGHGRQDRSGDRRNRGQVKDDLATSCGLVEGGRVEDAALDECDPLPQDRKSTRLNSSHVANSYAVFCLKKKIGST